MTKGLHRLMGFVAALLLPPIICAQEKKEDDKYVRLMSAQSVSTVDKDGNTFRQAEGPARFLHNDTWLICDTALWDVNLQVIYAMGNVSIEQENTELRSDKLTYYIEKDLAEFRGTLVELIDKDQNILRTHNLDYNTKDSVAIFFNGASMKDKDGQIIESLNGRYDSKIELFTFDEDVNMFSDSVFVKTSELLYDSRNSVATFPNYVDAWQQDRMMSGGNGHYNNKTEIFFFTDDVHTMSPTQEGWCDSLYFYKGNKTLELFGNAQIVDSTRDVTSLAGFIRYRDSLSFVTMLKDPLLMATTSERDSTGVERKDTAYMRADTLKYWKVMNMKVDSLLKVEAANRLKELSSDPVANMRKKAAEAAEQRKKEAEEKANPDHGRNGNKPKLNRRPPNKEEDDEDKEDKVPEPAADSLAVTDSLSLADTLLAGTVVYTAEDSIEFSFVYARKNVKVFRSDMQVICDSLVYTDLDSLARLYMDPVVWNSPKHQYNSDSLFIAVKDRKMDRANLMSNAFIHVEEVKDKYYDQIRGTEMIAFFDDNGKLKRFDALGGANALFYMKEKDEITMANRSEATMLTATFKDGEVNSISYYENPKSDAYPLPQMTSDNHHLRGFNWTAEKRPKSVADLSSRVARKTQRREYSTHPRAQYVQTDIYFPGYMAGVYRQIEISDSLKRVREENERIKKQLKAHDDSLSRAKADSLGIIADSMKLEVADSTVHMADSLRIGVKDSLKIAVPDSLAAGMDSLKTATDSVVVKTAAQLKKEEKERKAAERAAKRAAAEKKRQDKWDALDARDALKQAAKDAKKRQKKEKMMAAKAARLEKEKAREDALIEQYKKQYLKKQEKKEKKKRKKD